MARPRSRLLLPLLASALVLSACGVVEEAADQAGSAAESVVRDAAESAATEAVGSVVPENGSAVGPAAFAAAAVLGGTTLIDVRTPEEFAAGHLPGAVNLDLSADDFADRVAELDPEARYAVYCRTDARSGEAVRLMVDEGFTSVYHLEGGYQRWVDAGRDVVSGLSLP